jgi:cellulose synthase/poly-beta-1,6-N-acetylglucosamine synthase-like glycosyltransferase
MTPWVQRAAVDVVVPFAGSEAELRDLLGRFERIDLGAGDTLTVVDNRPPGGPAVEDARVVAAPDRQSSYFARNRGAARGEAEWLLFIDADVEPPPGLLDAYFAEPPDEGDGVLAGAVVDEPLDPAERHVLSARYAMLRGSMSQDNTLSGARPYAQTANCAVRRAAFESVGGFRDDIRSGGDADLCFRVADAGWAIRARPQAAVVHRSRTKLRKMLRQRARHGSGAAWLAREHPGTFERGSTWLGLAKWTVQSEARAAVALARGRRDDAVVAAIDPLSEWAFQVGRRFPNEVE